VLWWLLCVVILLGSLAALALAALRTWRTSTAFARAVGEAGDAVAAASEPLNLEMAAMDTARIPARDTARDTVRPREERPATRSRR
jgi:hypothetical protein